MRLIRQHDELPIKNVEICQNKIRKNYCRHSKLLPNSIRGIVVGPSNCGKTNVLITLLEHRNGLKFENVYVYSKSLYQPKYEYLKELLSAIKGIGFYTFSENNEVLPLDEAKKNSVFVFDDVACENQNHIRSYFCMGRHKYIDSFYLTQSYTRIPKHLIRDNANLLIIFKQDNLNLKHIYDNHVSTDMSFNQFCDMCSKCWKDDFGFLCINKDCSMENDRFWKNMDTYFTTNNNCL